MTGNKVNNIVEEVKNKPVVVGDTPTISKPVKWFYEAQFKFGDMVKYWEH